MKIINYMLVVGKVYEVEERVRNMILQDEGWEPHGPVQMHFCSSDHRGRYAQTMIRVSKEKAPEERE